VRPVRGEQLGLHDQRLPTVRARLAIAHESGRGGYLDFSLAVGVAGERLAHETSEHRRDEALEPDPLGVDRLLMGIHDFDDRLHHRAQQPAVTRFRIDRRRIVPCMRLVKLHGLIEDRLSGQPLVSNVRIVDQVLIIGDDGARVLQHLGQALRDRRVVAGSFRGRDRRNRHTAKQYNDQQGGVDGRPA
jgi:hypothetical protein